MPPVPWPTTAAPGRRPGEGTGELINVFAHKNVDELEWRRVPGLRSAGITLPIPVGGSPTPRGLYGSTNLLVAGYEGGVCAYDAGGARVLSGAVSGTDPMTFARNNRLPVPDIAMVCQAGAFLVHVDTNTVTAYSAVEPNVGAPNSVSYFDSYFMFTYGDGTIRATGNQVTAINANAYAKAEANPDGLYRGVSIGSSWLAMGPLTIEVWQDTGQAILPSGAVSPFPLTRATVIPVGLLGPWCVAGTVDDWDRPLLFVASDYTVRLLDGYAPRIVSTADVSADIYAERLNPNGLVACVYIHNDNAIWALSCASWTWCFNLTTTSWYKRASFQNPRWRVAFTAQAFLKWLGQDTVNTGSIPEITTDALDEMGQPLISRARSAPMKQFPINVRVPTALFDFTVALGSIIGSDFGAETPGTDPTVLISWSHDGGATWANPLRRTIGRQGEFKTLVRVNNLGRSSHHGIRFQWDVIDPVPFCFRGAVVPDPQPRQPSAVQGASTTGP